MDPYPAAYDRICLFLSDLNLVLGSVSSKAPSGPLGGHPPRFDHVRPGAFSTNPAWGRPTARSRAWKRNHPKIFGQYPSKFHRPSPPVPVDNGFSRSNGTWVIPMRRDRGLHRGREDRGQHRFSKPASVSTPSHNQQSQSHMEPTCEIIDESNLGFVSGLDLHENQPTNDYGEGIVIPEESADQFNSCMEFAENQSGDDASNGVDHPADRSDFGSYDGPRRMASGVCSDVAVCETYSDRPGSHLDDSDSVEEMNSVSDRINHPADGSDAESSGEPRGTTSGDHHDIVDHEIHSNHSGSQLDDSDPVEEQDPVDEQDGAPDEDDVSNPEPDDDYQSNQDDRGYDNHAYDDVYGNADAYQEVDYGADGSYDDGGGYDYGDDGGGYEDDGGAYDDYQDDYY